MDEQVIGDALLVPALRLAVMQTDEGMFALRGPESNALTAFHDGELGLIRDAGHLLLPVPKSDLQLDRIRQTLRIESDRQTALRFVLQGVDRALSDGLRRKSIELAEDQLRSQAVLEFVQNRLWGCSIPDDADVDGAIRIGGGGARRATGAIYVEMARLRPHLYRLENAWRQVSVQQPPDFPARHIRADLIDAGAFRRCAFALADGDGSTIKSLVMDRALASIIRARVPQPQHLLVSLSKALSEATVDGKQPATVPDVPADAVIETEEDDPIRAAILAAIEEARTDRIRLAEKSELILSKIEKQKNSILKEMRRGNISRARKYILDLVNYQISNGKLSYLCKSLSDLAARVLKLGEFIFADQLYDYAHLANDVDVFPLTGRAEVLKAQGELEQALAAYDDAARRFPQDVVPLNGRAEVLKAQGKLDQALAAYDEAARRFPQDVVPLTGRAEVLKAQGELEQALAAYDEAARRFPQDVVPLTGRAEVLKAQGKLDQALAAYDDAARRFPQDVVPLNGRAEVLKAQGELEQALAAYDDAARRFPQEVVPLNGRAEVLKAQGKLDQALAAYDEAARRFPQEVFPLTGRAEVLKAQGKLDQALAAYDDAARRFPQEVVPLNGRAEVLKAQGKLDQALSAYDDAARRFPQEVVPLTGRAEVLKAQGKLDQALAAYDEAARRFPQDVVPLTGRAEVLKAQGKLDQALAAYDEAARRFRQEVFPLTGRAEVLKAQGKLDQALAAYDEAARRFPQHVVPLTGRAEVLKAQGKLDQALAAYDEAARRFPQDVVPLTGRAEVLKAQGKLDQALAAYDEAGSRFPHNDICRNGRVTTLMKLGREAEVINELHDIRPVSIGDWIARHILGIAHLRLGQRNVARDIFSDAITRCPFASSIVYFQSIIAFMDAYGDNWQLSVDRLEPLMNVAGEKPTATIILFSQVLAMTGQKPRAGQQLLKLNAGAGAEIIEIKDAIARRHGLLGQPQATMQEIPALDTTIREGIFTTLLMAA